MLYEMSETFGMCSLRYLIVYPEGNHQHRACNKEEHIENAKNIISNTSNKKVATVDEIGGPTAVPNIGE